MKNPICGYDNCNCEYTPIEYKDHFIIVTIPKYVFAWDKEFAKKEGARLFDKLWNDNPEMREKKEDLNNDNM